MEFLVEFDIRVPDATSDSELNARVNAEAHASAELARNGHLVRLWSPPAPALDWLNKGIFIGVAGRRPGGVIYETYLVG